jgi:hypothetical protein
MTFERTFFRAALVTATLALGISGCKSGPATVDDATLTTNVKSALSSDAAVSAEPIQPTVAGGTVTLNGNVSNATARLVAAQDAAKVAGVKQVVNNLTVLGAQMAPTITTPAAPSAPRMATPAERRIIEHHESLPPPPSSSAPVAQQAPPPPPAPVYRDLTVPAGTGLSVRVTQTLDSATTQQGTPFSGVLNAPIVVDGEVAVPAGASVSGVVSDVHDAGHFSGNSLLSLQLTGLNRRGDRITIATDTYTIAGKGRGKNTAEKVGGGAAVGAILGGVFGGGKGAAIGAASGGALGAGANAVTRGQQVQINSESVVRFRLASSFTVRSLGPVGETGSNGGGLQQRPPY